GHVAKTTSEMALVVAHSTPLTTERLEKQFSRLGNTPFCLGALVNHLDGDVMLPVSELNRLRRTLVETLLELRSHPAPWQLNPNATYQDLLPGREACLEHAPSVKEPSAQSVRAGQPQGIAPTKSSQNPKSIDERSETSRRVNQNPEFPASPRISPPSSLSPPSLSSPHLIPLVRTLDQLQAVLTTGLETIYCEFENPVRYRDAMDMVREFRDDPVGKDGETLLLRDRLPIQNPKSKIPSGAERSHAPRAINPPFPLSPFPFPLLFVAPPRITKASEQYILKQVRQANADGYLVRNYDHLEFFAGERCIGDFSLNVANPITANYFKRTFGLERLTASYDLNVQQLTDLLETAPPDWFDVTIHQHMPMFHMEHCVFCAFLSEGTDFTNCGRPCETHAVKLRDRTGTEHILQADAGCRNTVFNGVAQTGAEFVQRLIAHGACNFRIDFLNETPEQVVQTLECYQQLLRGELKGHQLWQQLQLSSQLGVTRGTLEARSRA
ncbi:MAG: DUF3656 domain-containing protein, partial [Cyanobacteria bacterium P01_D01_bin.44]